MTTKILIPVMELKDVLFLLSLVRKSAQLRCSTDKESERLAEKARAFMKKHGMNDE